LESLPASLYTPDDSKNLIIDTGASCIVTGDKTDFVPETLKPLERPFPMNGISGSLTATHSGQCRYEVLADESSIVVLEATGFMDLD
jgi:hypothetical protein